jgi:serpin B
VPKADLDELVGANNAFALELFREVRDGTNLMISPASISIALAMAYAGARGETESQMATALHFTLPQARLHAAFNALDLALASRGRGAEGKDGKPFRLRLSNAAWGQENYPFESTYLDLLALNYGAGVYLLDFIGAPDDSRLIINDWVAYQTEDRIKDLLAKGTVTPETRLVLTNTVYFNAAWKEPFDEASTSDAPFYLAGGDAVTVPMMSNTAMLGYSESAERVAVEMPYDGDELSMVLVVPRSGDLDSLVAALDADALAALVQGFAPTNVALKMPKFEFKAGKSLLVALTKLGMPIAFSSQADFTGICSQDALAISDVIHQTFVAVDEAGTEAAAATAVVVGTTSVPPPPVEVVFDRPFLFFIRDIETGAVVFLGQVLDPG